MRSVGMPKDLRNARKNSKKAKGDQPENGSGQNGEGAQQIGMRTKELKIVHDDDLQCLVGINGTHKYRILGKLASAEEVWICGILPSNGMGSYEALPMELKKQAPKEEVVEVSEVQEEDVPVAESVIVPEIPIEQCEDPRIAEMEAKIADLEAKLKEKSDKHRDTILKYGRAQKRVNQADKMADELKQKDIAIASLKTQVQSLEKKINNRDIDNLESERDHYLSMLDEKDVEIARLKEVLALYESGAKETSVKTFLTGFTGIHCNMLGEGRYRVYFSPGKRTLRFVPDDAGDVVCPDGNVSIPAIGRFTHFEKIRALQAVSEDQEVIISLA